MLNIELANLLARSLPLFSCQVCNNHVDDDNMPEVHIHLLLVFTRNTYKRYCVASYRLQENRGGL